MSAERRETAVRRMCGLMGWEYQTSPVWAGLRKAALAEAVVVGLPKLEEIMDRIETLADRVRQLEQHHEDAMGLLGEAMATFRLKQNRDRIEAQEYGRELYGVIDSWQKKYDRICGAEELARTAKV